MTTTSFVRQLSILLIIIFAGMEMHLSAAQSHMNSPEDLPSLKGKKILMVWGGWKGHEPKEFNDKIQPLLTEMGAEVTVSDSLGIYADEALMATFDLIIHSWTMGKITKEQEKGLLNAIRNGAGIAGVHGGLGDSFRESTGFQYMAGGQFVAHPGGVFEHSVDITDTADPVTRGINSFRIKTEQYYLHVDPNVKVLATTTFSGDHDDWVDGAVIPAAWKKTYGKGRVFYFAIGHVAKDFDTPEAMEILLRGIRWASGSKYLPKEQWMSPVYPSGK